MQKVFCKIETKNPSGKPANCQPAGLPRGEMIPYIQANPRNFQLNRANAPNSAKTCITGHLSHLKTFIEKNIFFEKKEKKKEKKKKNRKNRKKMKKKEKKKERKRKRRKKRKRKKEKKRKKKIKKEKKKKNL